MKEEGIVNRFMKKRAQEEGIEEKKPRKSLGELEDEFRSELEEIVTKFTNRYETYGYIVEEIEEIVNAAFSNAMR